ncbi:MAG: ATP-binding protein [Gammaproteobacteria bacterium]|nr:ATP-binding protein [Gammaproteobacteria bacterium]
MSSLQDRLTAGLLSTLVAVFAVQWLLVSIAIEKITENYVTSRLEHEIETLLVALDVSDPGQPRLDIDRLNFVFRQPFSGHYYRVLVSGESLRSRSLWDQEIAISALSTGDARELHMKGPQQQPLLVLARGFQKNGLELTIAVAEDLSPIQRDITEFQVRYAVLTAAVLAALIFIQRTIVRRSLRPLRRTRADLRDLEQGKVRRLDESAPDEIKPMVQEINRLIAVIVERLRRSRNAVGNLAHALKTPLTVIAQISQDPALRAHRELKQSLDAQVHTVRRLVERELKRARLAGEGPVGSRFVVEREVPPLAQALRQVYAEKTLELDMALPEHHDFAGDREDVLELLGTLLDNACKWARRRVRLTADEAPGFSFRVEDDGPGVSDAQLSGLAQRGRRLDENIEGHGLGLSIAEDIVDQYKGTIEYGRSRSLGGFQVTVHLPPQRAAS